MKSVPEIQLSDAIHLIDSHCHLDMMPLADNLDQVIADAASNNVNRMITIGIDTASSDKAVKIATRYPGVYAAIGIHPHEAASCSEKALEHMARLSENGAVVAYGEIGLDYAKMYAPEKVQQKAFLRQLELARDLGLPVIIHDREAHADTLHCLRQMAPFEHGGVMHCFSGDIRLARQVLDLGLLVSIPGIVTFKNSDQLQEVARMVPLKHLLLETDAPFLAPVPFRGKPNHPGLLLYTAARVAELKQVALEVVSQQTTANAANLFRLP